MNLKKQLIYKPLSVFIVIAMISIGSIFSSNNIASAADCSDVYTPLSSFVSNGVNDNKTFYIQVMNETGVPWELLAAIHYRETNFSHTNPGNGQGIFQFVNGAGGPYPPGPVNDSEFVRQLQFMANRIQSDYALRNNPNAASVIPRRLVANEQDITLVKNTLYSYNGRASAYASQAIQYGYSQPYEGSPYVMNRFDCSRARMGIITRDYAAGIDGTDTRYGAFTLFSRLRGDAYWHSLFVPYIWAYVDQQAFSDPARTREFSSVPTTTSNGTVYVRVKARNIGSSTWNKGLFRIGTSRPIDRASIMAAPEWLSNTRAATLVENIVTPGQVGTFEFALKSPATHGTYNEYFNLLQEGQTWLNDPGLFFTVNVNSSSGATNYSNTNLDSGKTLKQGGFLMSPDSQSALSINGDGNLKLYSNFTPIWTVSSNNATDTKLIMQPDGNLVLYNKDGLALWNTETQGNPGAWLALQTDGNLVLYSQSGNPLWATYTLHVPDHLDYINTTLPRGFMYPGQRISTADKKYTMILQPDGNLVLYNQSGRPLWATGTDGKNISFLVLQSDGNLVLYDKNYKPLWHTSSSQTAANRLIMQPDGNLVLYTHENKPVWYTGTVNR